jgi:hypothetical protein
MQEAIDILDNHFTNHGHDLSVYMAWQGVRAVLVTSTNSSHNKQSTPCQNPLHNTQVEADGRCHWCESSVKL